MLQLDDDSLLSALDFLPLTELLHAESSCKRMRALSLSSGSFWWRRLVRQFGSSLRGVVLEGDLRALSLQILAVVRRDPQINLLQDVLSASSVDREEESPRNVLRPSRCYDFFRLRHRYSPSTDPDVGLAYFQMLCGCANGSPCYWSSRPNHSPDKVESMELELSVPVALVIGIVVTPYQALFQPNAPVYAPRTVVVKFKDQDGKCYFESEPLAVENRFTEQRLVLERPALFLGGTPLLELRHMYQRQTLEGLEDFYMCLSHLRISGLELPGFDVASVGDARRLSKAEDSQRRTHPVKLADRLVNQNGDIELLYL